MYPAVHAASTPDKPAVVMAGGGEVVTYRELEDRSARLARLLRERGLRPGDTVGLLAENHPRYFEVLWAAMRSGLYLTAVNRYATEDEVAYVLADAGAAALVTTARYADVARAALARVPGCRTRLVVDGPAAGFEPYETAVEGVPAGPLPDETRGDMMLYSSGTTGRPKGIRRPLSGLPLADPAGATSARMCANVAGMDGSAVYLSPAPLYHAAPLGWTRGVHELGGTVVVMERFDPAELLAVVERERVTHLQAVPTMFVRLLKLPAAERTARDLSSLRCVVHSAAPCPVPVKRQVIDWLGPIVTEYYSGTEGAGMTVITAPEWLERPGSVGRAVLGVPHVCAADGSEVAAGETGLVYFARDTAAFDYHNDPGKTAATRHPDHPTWSTLGDLGHLDPDGYLYLTDRSAFTIISGGVNVYPAEVEAALVLHPAVADVAVFGLPDPDMGEYVHAVVQPADGVVAGDVLAAELREYARAALAAHKVPRVVDFRAELPRLPTGKLYKVPLREEYLAAAR